MEIKLCFLTARSVTLQLEVEGLYEAQQSYQLFLNDQPYGTTRLIVNSLFGLKPDTAYECRVCIDNETVGAVSFTTLHEFVTLNVRDFGARGDGAADDTPYIQAAILSCPQEGRVLIPKGVYSVSHLFLKSDMALEIAKDAKVIGNGKRYGLPMLPGVIESYHEEDEYNLGSWEGNPLTAFASLITGIHVKNTVVYGEGMLDGGADAQHWWDQPKVKIGAYRGRMVFLNRCKNISFQGLTLQNSPAWNLHPYFSKDLGFYSLNICSPASSPNTDGFDPESCKRVVMLGTRFSVGDDCIAIKSGKIYMGEKYKTPCKEIEISHCLMEDGHGAVTVGSEMAGGIKDIYVHHCKFRHTDRGLRIKTRRGRGKNGVITRIAFENIEMEHVQTPFVVNSFYFCDPDGKSEYAQTRESLPVDERTPSVQVLSLKNIKCTDCHVAAGWFEGLPEQKITEVKMKNVTIDFAADAREGIPAMSNGVSACRKKGLLASNIRMLQLEHVVIQGQEGPVLSLNHVDHINKNGGNV